jgi:hypothetical protein
MIAYEHEVVESSFQVGVSIAFQSFIDGTVEVNFNRDSHSCIEQ